MSRLAVFAHFDPDGVVDPHVRYYLERLRRHCDELVFVTSCGASEAELRSLSLPVTDVLSRENVGLDFASWRDGLRRCRWRGFDEVLLCNDSVYGPLFDLARLFGAMAHRHVDFWGVTESYQIAYHLQSYFVVFGRRATSAAAFARFWDELEPLSDKKQIVRSYEVGLSQALLAAGLRAAAYASNPPRLTLQAARETYWHIRKYPEDLFDAPNVLNGYRRRNPTHDKWRQLLDAGVPFVKVELARINPRDVDIADLLPELTRRTGYPVALIEQHLARVGSTRAGLRPHPGAPLLRSPQELRRPNA